MQGRYPPSESAVGFPQSRNHALLRPRASRDCDGNRSLFYPALILLCDMGSLARPSVDGTRRRSSESSPISWLGYALAALNQVLTLSKIVLDQRYVPRQQGLVLCFGRVLFLFLLSYTSLT